MTIPDSPSPGGRRKRLAHESNENSDTDAKRDSKRQRPRSRSEPVGGTPPPALDFPVTPQPRPPPSGYDLDRLNYHIDLQDFAKNLQDAANRAFSSEKRSRYAQVSCLLLSWEDEDPQLPVSIEINSLKDIFVEMYRFEVEEWQIPAENSHMQLNQRVLNFLEDSSAKHLKIVYYAGHGKLSNHGQALWTSRRNSTRNRCPTVKWSGIQNALEESHSDVLVLLDCCASGMSNTDEGNGVTELIAACAFNNTANGVGPFSFTHALISQLQKLVGMPSFTVGYLYNLIFTEIQSWRLEDPRHKKAPVHLVLTQDHRLPRSITISAKRQSLQSQLQRFPLPSQSAPLLSEGQVSLQVNDPYTIKDPPSPSSSAPDSNNPVSSIASMPQLPEYPRLLFSIRISEDIKPTELHPDLFADWLVMLPIASKYVRVEAGFGSDSTLLMVSAPAALLSFLALDPAITMLGTTWTANLMAMAEDREKTAHPERAQYLKPFNPFNLPRVELSEAGKLIARRYQCGLSGLISRALPIHMSQKGIFP